MTHPLLDALLNAAEKTFPPVDGLVTFLPPLANGHEAIVAFTGHTFVASRYGESDLADFKLDGYGAALGPEVLIKLADGGTVGINDVTLCGRGVGGEPELTHTTRWNGHQRVAHARALRTDVDVFGDARGLVTIGTGLAGRLELSIETVPESHSTGVGRQLIAAALSVIDRDLAVFAAVSPGNARSLRAFLACGFVPIASEVIITPHVVHQFR